MGGQGSGGHNYKGRFRDVQCARLDVHELAREGKLELGARGLLFGMLGFEVDGGPDGRRLVLEYPRKSASGTPLEPLRQAICCSWRKAHYGGRYLVFLCSECQHPARVLYARYRAQYPRDLVLHVPQVRRHHLPVHHGPPLGPLGPSGGEIACKARMAVRRHYSGQAARDAPENVPAHLGDDSAPRGRAKAGCELRSEIATRPAPCTPMAAMPEQVCEPWRVAASQLGGCPRRPGNRFRLSVWPAGQLPVALFQRNAHLWTINTQIHVSSWLRATVGQRTCIIKRRPVRYRPSF